MIVSKNQLIWMVLFFVVFESNSILAQSDWSEREYVKRFPTEKAVVLNSSEHLFIRTIGDTFDIKSHHSEETIYLSDLGAMYADKSINYNSFSRVVDVKAQTLIPKEKIGKYSSVKANNFSSVHVASNSVFYDDNEALTFSFPEIKKGAKTVLNHTIVYHDPKFIPAGFFISHLPVLNSEFKVTFPDNVEIAYKIFNIDESKVIFTQSKEGLNNTFTWSTKDLMPFKSVDGAPDFKYYAPHVIVYIKNIKLATKSVTVFPDMKAYYNWSYSLIKGINTKVDNNLKAIVDSLVKGVSDPDTKAKLVFYWVQDNIKYVAFEDGMGGFIPRQAAAVCQKRYGDCKDMASIITEMLKYAGVKSYMTLIGARNLPYKYSEIPTLDVNNHMIATYKNTQNQMVFLDATGSYTPYGYPTAMIQGKESLVCIGKEEFEIATVPIVPKEQNLMYDKVNITLDGNTIRGKGVLETSGYQKLEYVYPLLDKNDQKRLEAFQSMMQKGSNKFLIESTEFKGLSNRDSILNVNYTFNLQDYSNTNKDEIYINLHLDKKFSSHKIEIDKRRGVPLEFEYAFKDINEVILTIPSGYELGFVPENVSSKFEHFGFELSYQVKKNQLLLKTELYNDLLLVSEADFTNWNQMVKTLNMAYKELVILKKVDSLVKKK